MTPSDIPVAELCLNVAEWQWEISEAITPDSSGHARTCSPFTKAQRGQPLRTWHKAAF